MTGPAEPTDPTASSRSTPGSQPARSKTQPSDRGTDVETLIDLDGVGPVEIGPADRVRAQLAMGFFLLFAVTVLAAVALTAILSADAAQLKELLAIIIPAETGLLGSAVGFYFGARSTGTT